jgi:hypothetical protein
MGKKDKLILRLKSKPKDFTFDELRTLLELLGYVMSNSGKTSGSRVHFKNGGSLFRLHKPHPRNELSEYVLKDIIDELKKEGLI